MKPSCDGQCQAPVTSTPATTAAAASTTGSRYPDLVIGLLIGLLVLNGSRRILALQPGAGA